MLVAMIRCADDFGTLRTGKGGTGGADLMEIRF